MQRNWFEDWFDSPYYHLLYQHRDEKEAGCFLDKLSGYLQLPAGSKVLDLACGRGRHSVYLSKKEYDVTGLDLSPCNIAYAKASSGPNLHFDQHDMREVYKENEFHCIFNLFTSFGYFESMEENIKVLQSVHTMLVEKGLMVLDYLNIHALNINECEASQKVNGVEFTTSKKIEEGKLYKYIHVKDGEKEQSFREELTMYSKIEFLSMFEKARLNIKAIFGNYNLDSYQPDTSERLILIGEKS